jgi:gliding motility-associated-like protein
MNLKYLLFIVIFIASINTGSSQLSFLSVLDSFPGSESEFVPIPEGFITLNGSFEDDEAYGFRMSKFDKCGSIEWTKEYASEALFYNQFGSPEAVKDQSGEIYMVLSNAKDQGEGNILCKLSQSGVIEWSYLLHGTINANLSSAANILYNKYTDTLSLTLNNELNNATIIQFNRDGEILGQKEFEGFRFHSSTIGNDGSIIMANDTAIIKVDDDLELVWAKRLNSHSTFIQCNDPIVELDDQINLMAIDTFGTALDSFYYSLLTLNEDGDFIANSDGVRGEQIGSVDLQQRGANKFMFLDRTIGTNIEGNTSLIANQIDYSFCADTIPFCTSNMNTCIDNSLLMSGFYYEKPDSIQFFMGKTDPMGALNCEEKAPDSLDSKIRQLVVMDSIHFDSRNFDIIIDTLIFETETFLPEQEMPCFTPIVENQDNEFQPCPCDQQTLAVSWLKGADYLWNTGDSTNFITVDTSGTYTVNVNLCGTEMLSTFEVAYKTISQCAAILNNSPQCPGFLTSLGVIHGYGNQLDLNWSTGETEDSISVAAPGQYTVNLAACNYTDQVSFDVVYKSLEDDECKLVRIPNAFVPNSTQYEDNKTFKIYTKLAPEAFTDFHMVIFDRWGEKVFESNDPFLGWNGTFRNQLMPPAVYVYGISYEIDLGGELYKQSFEGQVLLVK